MKRRPYVLTALLLATALLMSGCGSKPETGTSATTTTTAAVQDGSTTSAVDTASTTAAGADTTAVIYHTFERARASGDRYVWMIDGADLFGTGFRDCCTVDGCHPNDLGFLRMAETVLPVLRKALNLA